MIAGKYGNLARSVLATSVIINVPVAFFLPQFLPIAGSASVALAFMMAITTIYKNDPVSELDPPANETPWVEYVDDAHKLHRVRLSPSPSPSASPSMEIPDERA